MLQERAGGRCMRELLEDPRGIYRFRRREWTRRLISRARRAKRVAHLRAKIEINSKTRDEHRRFTARGVSRRLIKTESTLRPTEMPCPTARTRSDGIFEATVLLLCTQARRVRETGLRRIIIPFQVNVLYLAMWVQREAPGASPIRSYATRWLPYFHSDAH